MSCIESCPSIREARQRGVSPWQRLRRWRQLSRERRQLRELDDRQLRDIGLSRREVEREARRAFWDDAGWRR